ncbi:MAG TPA: ATP-binding protein [Anaeromyxobacteraceae bacterium]|nr:ATP-binding protein [Anaeromyxobacteraceae bacterium]
MDQVRDETGSTPPEGGAPPARPRVAVACAAFDALPLPALVMGRGGAVLAVNRALEAATGFSAADLAGRDAATALASTDGDGLRLREAWTAAEAGRPWGGEVVFRRADGGVWAHELAASPVSGPEAEGACAVALCQDLAARRQSQARLLATDRMVSVGTLAAGVAHEINNPLAFLLTNLHFAAGALEAEGGAQPLGPVREALQEAIEGAERVREIVRDLKAFARSDERGRGPVDVERVLESSVKMAWNEIRHRARLVRRFGRVPPVLGEEARLGQVFLNLVLNAVQAIPEGDVSGNTIELATRLEGDRVVVEVRDSGPGIPEAIRPQLFTPFFTTKPAGVGTGLGLYICRDIVGSLGGTVEALPAEGGGTVLRVALPTAAARKPAPPARARVLVVDDEPMIGATLTRVLAGHEVVALASPREALRRVEAGEAFDLVLLDLMMPEMTGMELYEALARSVPAAAERVVFLSGGLFTPAARAFAERVKNLILEKPFDAAALRRLVAERLAAERGALPGDAAAPAVP